MLRLAVLAAVLVVAPALLPASAGAHASLTSAMPADEQVVDAAPERVELQFSGMVVAGEAAVQVFGPDGDEVQSGAPSPTRGERISQRIESDEHGTYGIAYRVSSEDGHVITGTTTFVVVEPSYGGDRAARASQDAASVDRGMQLAFSVTRFVEILALLLAAGSGLFACVIVPGWRPRLLAGAIATLLVAYLVGYVLNAAIIGGTSVMDAITGDALRATSDTPFALSLQVRAIIALVALGPALLLRYGPPLGAGARASLAVVFVALAASMSITGHAATTEPTWLRMPLDMAHVAAAAIWIGGLLQLAFLAPFATAHVDAVQRFSRIAFASVMVLLVTGVFATWAELGLAPKQLIESTYGRLILAKLVLYAGTMPLAFNNMSAFVPQLQRRPDDAPRMLRQYVWRELALLVVVVALTVWLIATPQP